MVTCCGCGCGQPKRGKSAYASDACRTRAWKQRVGYARNASENGGNGNRNGHPVVPRTASRASGRQISYAKARRELIARLWHFPNGEQIVDDALQAALPERQRRAT